MVDYDRDCYAVRKYQNTGELGLSCWYCGKYWVYRSYNKIYNILNRIG